MLKVTNGLLDEIREGQKLDLHLLNQLEVISQGKLVDFKEGSDGILRFRDRICVPDLPELRKLILEEGHKSSLSVHPGATKMYKDLKKIFWWSGMKKDVAKFVYSCLVCQKAKIEH